MGLQSIEYLAYCRKRYGELAVSLRQRNRKLYRRWLRTGPGCAAEVCEGFESEGAAHFCSVGQLSAPLDKVYSIKRYIRMVASAQHCLLSREHIQQEQL